MALAARRGFVASLAVGRSSVFPLLHRFFRDRSPRCLPVKARRAESSLRCGPHHPALASLTASPSPPRFFAGDELRKDGGNGDQPRSLC